MKKNGKDVNCVFCGEEFYLSGSRLGVRKYCSRECAKKDDYGFKPRDKNCAECGDKFRIENSLRTQDKYCGTECAKIAFREKQQARYEMLRNKVVVRKCVGCEKEFEHNAYFKKKFCSNDCQFKFQTENRKGEGNPNYRHGKAAQRKKANRSTPKHSYACVKYKKQFVERHEYLFCEVCKVNQNGTPRFEVHHIYYASLFPRHEHLHNPKNLILLCTTCHHSFHSGKMRSDKFLGLEKERGLKELFDNYPK